ncbi:phosphatidylethanolamine N-methyltransferase /phosphatidyl-N-methylethanolamine N-methyltransferase [Mesorhizobium sp. J18]|uniref:phospholipid N-methyltransferase PmtA n=1 Tax=Mesorhizobium sp. J18 TaxID=935263 RepID=UPI0011990C2E|nr:class I SAM-dependent methyltransferase [Mesorhizobium sp. J18]TWG88928.1 phosphatidylethanolamine N-methyltransferase /phosphatidyl-N-methylethanolamine N-methyltransferase [Mesorhizobium sp. J18]
MTIASGFRKAIADKFDEELRFFRGWIDKPKAVGAIIPTSSITARRMASVVDPDSGGLVLELGPGTGVITKAILDRGVRPKNLISIEYSREFVDRLKADFPGVNFIHGSAFDLGELLAPWEGRSFDSVISAIPMLNFPVADRISLTERLLDLLPLGRPIMQITYGAVSPIPSGRGSYSIERFDFVMRNIPPAHLWIYRRVGNA